MPVNKTNATNQAKNRKDKTNKMRKLSVVVFVLALCVSFIVPVNADAASNVMMPVDKVVETMAANGPLGVLEQDPMPTINGFNTWADTTPNSMAWTVKAGDSIPEFTIVLTSLDGKPIPNNLMPLRGVKNFGVWLSITPTVMNSDGRAIKVSGPVDVCGLLKLACPAPGSNAVAPASAPPQVNSAVAQIPVQQTGISVAQFNSIIGQKKPVDQTRQELDNYCDSQVGANCVPFQPGWFIPPGAFWTNLPNGALPPGVERVWTDGGYGVYKTTNGFTATSPGRWIAVY